MKYKNIASAIYNFGHSFLSPMNYIDNVYVIDEIETIIAKGKDIKIDWLNNHFEPKEELTPIIEKSINQYCANLSNHLQSQSVDIKRIKALSLYLPIKGRKYMLAVDDRDVVHKIFVSEIK